MINNKDMDNNINVNKCFAHIWKGFIILTWIKYLFKLMIDIMDTDKINKIMALV